MLRFAVTVIFVLLIRVANVLSFPLSVAPEAGVSRYCGAVLYNKYNNVSNIVNCDFMSTTSWPTQLLIYNTGPIEASFPDGALRLSFFGTYVMPPVTLVNPEDDRPNMSAFAAESLQEPNYLSDFNGYNLRDYWFNQSLVGRKFPDEITIPIPWCSGTLDYAIPYTGNVSVVQLYPPDYPLGTNTVDVTIDECRSPLLFNYKAIGGSTSAQRFDTHCNGTFDATCLATPRFTQGTERTNLPSFPYPTRPELAELNNFLSYVPRNSVNRWGRNYFSQPTPGYQNFWGLGFSSDQGDDLIGSYTWLRPENCTMELYTSRNLTPIINFDFTGLYDQQDGAPVLIEWDKNVPAANATRPWMNRVSFMPGLSCFALNPRPSSSLRYSETNVALVTAICRASAPWNATKYNTLPLQDGYYTVTGGKTQPANIPINTVVVQLAVYNLPSDNLTVYTTVDAVQYARNSSMTPLVIRVSDNLFLRNGFVSQFAVDYTRLPDTFQNVWDLYVTVFSPSNNPILALTIPLDNSIPSCECKTQFTDTVGNVICDNNGEVFDNVAIQNPLFIPGQTTVRPNCSIVLTPVGNSYLYGNDSIEQNALYQVTVNINGSSEAGYIVGWNIMNQGAVVAIMDSPASQTTTLRVLGEGPFDLQAAITVPFSLLKGTCSTQIKVLRTCPVPAISTTTLNPNLNEFVTLDATIVNIPSGEVVYGYTWSIENVLPATAASFGNLSDPYAPVIRFVSSHEGVFTVLLRFDTLYRPDLSALCTQYLYLDIDVQNKSVTTPDPGFPDEVSIPNECFEFIGNFTGEIPPSAIYYNGLPPSDPFAFRPIAGQDFTADSSWVLTKFIRSLARLNFTDEDPDKVAAATEEKADFLKIAYIIVQVFVGIFGGVLLLLVTLSLYLILPRSVKDKMQKCCNKQNKKTKRRWIACLKCRKCKCCGKTKTPRQLI